MIEIAESKVNLYRKFNSDIGAKIDAENAVS
jgi:hypothetical protein